LPEALLVLAYLFLVIVLISVFSDSGNLVIQVTLFGEPEAMTIKKHDLPLYTNTERDNILSSRILNSGAENITVKKDQEFPIILESNPTTGYQWIPTFNTRIINLVSHSFEPATTITMGGPGTDIFRFKAIDYGTQELKMFYKRSWEKEFAKEKVFVVNVR
jgi:predicted secreted protein